MDFLFLFYMYTQTFHGTLGHEYLLQKS